MSLSVDGVWKTGVWATTVWADGVWREGDAPVVEIPVVAAGGDSSKFARKRKSTDAKDIRDVRAIAMAAFDHWTKH